VIKTVLGDGLIAYCRADRYLGRYLLAVSGQLYADVADIIVRPETKCFCYFNPGAVRKSKLYLLFLAGSSITDSVTEIV